MTERLQKFLARQGVASRRAAERLILEGRVQVNGVRIRRLGTQVDPARDDVRLDGRRVQAPRRDPTYLMLHKPRGCITTLSDPQGRPTVGELLPKGPRLFPVGRLDFDSEGLLLITDDGGLARDLMHPSRGVTKTYEVKVRGTPGREALARLAHGVLVDGSRTAPARLRVLRAGVNTWLAVSVTEGRKHLIRKMFRSTGHPVVRLRRVGYGGLALGRLRPGELRRLTPREVSRLRRACGGTGSP